MTKLTQGEKSRRANIRAMKALGAKNAKLRAAKKVDNFLAHVDRNNQAAEQAAQARLSRIAAHEQAQKISHETAVAARAAEANPLGKISVAAVELIAIHAAEDRARDLPMAA